MAVESSPQYERLENGGSRKRRKLSASPSEDDKSASDSDVNHKKPPKPSNGINGSNSTSNAQPSISRIKRKTKAEDKPNYELKNTEVLNGKIVDSTSSFATLDVAPWLIASLAAMEVKRPTAIQKACIPALLSGSDVIGGSRTGSGKTIAFAVPICQLWAADPSGIFAVVLTPTRELALQIYEQFVAIASPQGIKAVLVTGGVEMRPQALELASRPHVVIATPGRLADHITNSGEDTIMGLRRTKVVVLDEADRLLAAGKGSMLPDVEICLGALPSSDRRQTCLFTATLTEEVMALKKMPRAKSRPPLFVCEIETGGMQTVPPTLTEYYLQVPLTYREAYLHMLLQTDRNEARKSIIIFCNRTSTADYMERLLRTLDHRVTSLHSKLPQSERNSNLARFRASAAKILVATDVASRGLDIPEVELVVNYDVPRNPDDYIHRVGRTARAGRAGDAVTLVGQRDVELILAIEARTSSKMSEYVEEGVNIETRVLRDGLKDVGDVKRSVLQGIEEGRDVKGNRIRGKLRRIE